MYPPSPRKLLHSHMAEAARTNAPSFEVKTRLCYCCLICKRRDVVVLAPCRHAVICRECASLVLTCPQCGRSSRFWYEPWIVWPETRLTKVFLSGAVDAETNAETLCAICTDKNVACIIGPCGHASCCYSCADKILKCPICISDIEYILSVKLYSSTVMQVNYK